MMRLLIKKIAPSNEKTKRIRLQQHCKQAITTLLVLHKKHNTSHCILVIGQPESGKSALCASSGTLLFSSVENNVPHESAFEIYKQDQALFLHIPRDFFLLNDTRQQQRAWHFLASRLKHQRNYLPISHCLICIDLYDFLTRTKISNDTRLSQLALAVNSLANKIKTPLSVSLFFTKTDLIAGFNEFFDHQNKEFLEQPWGISLNTLSRISREKTDHWQDCIRIAYEKLIKKLNQQLLWRIHHEANPDHLYAIKSFPLAMEAIKHKLSEILPLFLVQWSGKKYLTPAQLYFVSCRQFRELKEAGNFSAAPAKNGIIENQTYFFTSCALTSLCQYNITHATSCFEKATRTIFVVLGGLLLLAFISFTAKQFSQHMSLVRNAAQIINQASAFSQKSLLTAKLNDVNSELVTINNSLNSLQENQQSLLVGRYIFSDDAALTLKLEMIYQHIAIQKWTPIICQRLQDFIHSHLTSKPEQAYIAFKIYLMLSQPSDAINTNYINMHLTQLLGDEAVIARLPKSTDLENNIQAEFVKKCRDYFLSLPADKLAYILLFSNLDTRTPIDVAKLLEKQPSTLVPAKKPALIPAIYTAKKFSIIYNQRLLQVVNETAQGNNVLGKHSPSLDVTDEILLSQLQEEYTQLYRNTWEETLKNIHLTKAETLEDFSTQLLALSSVDSPILSLLKLSQTNTALPEIEKTSPFLKAFNNTLTPQSTPDNSALFHSFIFIKKLNAEVLKIQESSDPKTATCDLLKQEYAATEQNPSDAQQIRFLATQLPEPIQSWLQQLVDNYYALLNQQNTDCR